MKIKMAYPTIGMSGAVANSPLVFVHGAKTSTVHARAKTAPRQPNSAEQQATKSWQSVASKVWGSLSYDERLAWNRFAEFISAGGRPRRGFDVCREAARMRCAMDLAPRREPPVFGYPERVRVLSLEPAPSLSELRLRVEHCIDAPAGYMLLVRMTPNPVGGSMPRAGQARHICGPTPRSFTPLPESGGVVSFSPIRFEIPAGRHFGVEAVVVRAEDGLASAPNFFVVQMPQPLAEPQSQT